MAYDPNYFLKVLNKATGESKDWNKRRIKQNNIGDIKNELASNTYNLSRNEKRFLQSYLNNLENHEEKAERIKLIKQNFSRIETIFDTLQQEVNEAKEEERTLEKLAQDLNDKKVQKKIKNYDKPEIEDLRKKLNHLLKMKKEMEDREQSLEKVSENFNHISHALSQRIDLVKKTISEDSSGSGGTGNMKIVSVSDVHGFFSEWEDTIDLLGQSGCSYPSLGNGNYELVINGNAFDYTANDRGSQEMLNEIMDLGSRGNFRYIFGMTDQYILFKEFWSVVQGGVSPPNNDNSFHISISDNHRASFIKEISDSNGFITGVWPGDHNYTYANASPCSDGRTNQRLREAAGAMWDLKMNKEPKNHINPREFSHAVSEMRSRFSNIHTDESDHKLGDLLINGNPETINRDLDFTDPDNPDNLEALVAIQYLIQFEGYSGMGISDCNEIFEPGNGTLWREWPDLVTTGNPGKLIVGRTKSNDCNNEGSPFFRGNGNPRSANNGDQINERTISSPDPNSLIIEEQGDNITAIRENPGSGDIEEESP